MNKNNGEVWKIIEDFPRYEVSNNGRVRSNIGVCKILKAFDTNKGYYCVRLCGQVKQKGVYNTKDFKVHRLVAKYFCENYRDDCEVHHVNRNRSDNKATNLLCLTKKEHAEIHSKERKERGVLL